MWQSIGDSAGTDSDVGRTVVGLMSGTSLDGVDVAIVRLRGSGSDLDVKTVAFSSLPYPDELRAAILRNSEPQTSSVSELATLNAELAQVYANAVQVTCQKHDMFLSDMDLVGSHGQTVYHDPAPASGPSSTLQLGDPAMLAHFLGIPVVGDFRPADVALGGQGAPLVPYFDWALFTSSDENRVLLNLGGIANITILPAGCRRDDVVAFDTGPANVVIDALMNRFTGRDYDDRGGYAGGGTVQAGLLQELVGHPYFSLVPPKSTGRELFNSSYVEQLVEKGSQMGISNQDLVATATELTIQSILSALSAHVPFRMDRIIVSGGGVHNEVILAGLAKGLPETSVDSIARHGLDPDAKEAVCFAVLAYEAMNGVATGMPSVTGARGRAFSGKICLPGK